MVAHAECARMTICGMALPDMPGSDPAGSPIDEAVAAIRAGQPVVLPTDTVYGLCADAYRDEPVRVLARLKARPAEQPIALLAADLDAILDAVPELRGRAAVIARALVPGPYTLVVPNPARRFRWLTGANAEAVGIRVPDLPAETRAVLERVTLVAATSANAHGGADPARVDEIPEEIRALVGAILDVGTLPGTPSTVVDLTGREPRVLREGAVPAGTALERARGALTADPRS
jgi:L-threonylcarbamoyladenylate synthase